MPEDSNDLTTQPQNQPDDQQSSTSSASGMESGIGTASSSNNVSALSFKNLPFWPENPDVWFAVLEGQFTVAQMRSDSSKYFTALGLLDAKTVNMYRDIILSPPANGLYDNLKRVVLSRLTESDDIRLQKLLHDAALGDKKNRANYCAKCEHWQAVSFPIRFCGIYGFSVCRPLHKPF